MNLLIHKMFSSIAKDVCSSSVPYKAGQFMFIGTVCRTETIHQILYFKSKFPNHSAFTLGRYLFLLLWSSLFMWMLTIVVPK